MRRVFVLGAGFSASQGYPLVRDMKAKLEAFASRADDGLLRGIFPQYQDESRVIDPSGNVGFEELFARMLLRLGEEHAAVWAARMGVAQLLWKTHQAGLPKECYQNFARWFDPSPSRPTPGIITFNWDLTVEAALQERGLPWRYNSYAVGPCVPLIKPHGSINWNGYLREHLKPVAYQGWRSIDQARGNKLSYDSVNPLANPDVDNVNQMLRFMLFPGDDHLSAADADLVLLWDDARRIIDRSEVVIFIGYSLPSYDMRIRQFLKAAIGKRSIEVYDPSQQSLATYEDLFGSQIALRRPEKFEECKYAQPPRESC